MKPIFKWLAAASGTLFVGFLVWYFHTIVFYIITAAIVALIGKPIVRLLSKVKIKGHVLPSWVKSAITLVLLFSLFIGLASSLIPVLIEKLKFLSHYNIDQLDVILREPIQEIERAINDFLPSVNFSLREVMIRHIEPYISSGVIKDALNSLTMVVIDLMMGIFCVAFISFFFLKDETLFNKGVAMLFPKRYEANIQRAISSITNLLIRYFIGICAESAIKFIFVALGAYIFGLDWGTSVMIGLATAVLNVIPYIGPLLGALIAFIITAVTPIEGIEVSTLLLEVGMVLLVFQLIDNIILQPYIYSSSVKAHPLEIFIVILMAGYMAGVLGMLFAIPAYTVLRVIAKEFFNHLRVVQKLTENI